MGWLIWDVFICILEVLSISYMFNGLMLKKSMKHMRLGCVLTILALCFNTFAINMLAVRTLFVFAVFFAYACLVFNDSLSRKACLCTMVFVIMNVSEVIAFEALRLGNINVEQIMDVSIVRFQFQALYLIISCLLYYCLANVPIKLFKRDMSIPGVIRLYIMILIAFSCIAVQLLGDISVWLSVYGHADKFNIDIVVLNIVIIIFSISFIVLAIWVGSINKQKLDQIIETDRMRNELSHIKDAEMTVDLLRLQKHDFRAHMQVLAQLLNENKMEEMHKYFEDYSLAIDSLIETYTVDQTLNACLVVKKQIAVHNGISCTINCYAKDIPLDKTDACALISNLLDNAIEACAFVRANLYIKLEISEVKQMVMIRIENSASGVYELTEGKSSKAGLHHGYGLKQINRITKRAKGYCDVEALGDKVILKVFLPKSQERII